MMTYIHFNHFPIRPGRQEVTLSPEKKKIMGKNNTLEHPISTRPRLHTYSSKKQGVVNQAAIRHSTEPSIRTELDSGVRPIPYKKQFGGMTSF